jgi:predicted nucleic acid-binding protein
MPFQLTIYSPDKILLRQELEEATAKYLKKNKITKLPDSPAVKVPSVGMTSLKIFGDEREFYEEAALGHLDMNLLEMDTV